jgi:hypothetical protein
MTFLISKAIVFVFALLCHWQKEATNVRPQVLFLASTVALVLVVVVVIVASL